GGCTRNHRVGAAQRKIPLSFRHSFVVIRRIGGLMKSHLEIFPGEKSLVFGNEMRRPAGVDRGAKHRPVESPPEPLVPLGSSRIKRKTRSQTSEIRHQEISGRHSEQGGQPSAVVWSDREKIQK